jgi:hypothetical protein
MHNKISESINVHELPSCQLQALWVLDKLSDSKERLSASDIAKYLIEICLVSATRQAIASALEKENGLCNKNKDGYKIMQAGKTKLQQSNSSGRIFLINPNESYKAKTVVLKEIFSSMGDEILICDPYIDIKTLDVVFRNIDKEKSVRILTQNIQDKPSGVFKRNYEELFNEGYKKISIQVYSKSELHDRYILDQNSLWLSGYSLNGIGNKESFLINLGKDFHQNMLEIFNRRWKAALPFT